MDDGALWLDTDHPASLEFDALGKGVTRRSPHGAKPRVNVAIPRPCSAGGG